MQEAYRPPRSHSKSLLFWGGSADKNFFVSLNMYHAKSGVKKFSLYWGGVPSTKIFFSSLNMYQAKSGVKFFSLYWVRGGSLDKNFFSGLNMYQAKSGVKKFSLYWDWVPPPPDLRLGNPPTWTWTWDPLGLGTPHTLTWTWDPPPKVNRTDNFQV